MNGKNLSKPLFVYIGRMPCGCVCTVISDIPEIKKDTAKMVADCIEDGQTIDRVTMEYYRTITSNEPNFMACPHNDEPAVDPNQPELFS